MKKLYRKNNFYLEKDELEKLAGEMLASYSDGFGVNLEEGAKIEF